MTPVLEDFIQALKRNVEYWDKVPGRTCKEKLEGCTHSFLCMLDGVSGSFSGNIYDIQKSMEGNMSHDHLHKKDKHED